MRNKEIAAMFIRFGQLLEMADENPFKVRAYFKAAENIENLSEDVEAVAQDGRLGEIAGIGKALEEKIIEYLKTGRMEAYDKLTLLVPESLLMVMNIPTVGPKKAKLFFDKLGVKSVDDLARVAAEGALLGLPGIKEKTIEKIFEGIAILKQGQERMTIAAAFDVAQDFVDVLKRLPEVRRVEIAGSLRRCKETIGDIDLLVDASDPAKVMDAFVHLPQVKSINGHGTTKSSVLTKDNIQVDLRIVDHAVFGAALLHLTGSQSFNVKIRQWAIRKDMKVSEYGVWAVGAAGAIHELPLPSDTEEKCFKTLGLPFIPPELREDIGEERLWGNVGAIHELPLLVELNNIKGDLHTHSTYSDGRNSIEEMAAAAQALGYQYLAVSDHSERLKVARGVSEEDLLKKIKEIEGLNKKLKGFRILCGSEVEIDSDGNLDYNEKTLERLDFVIASVHSGFEQSQEQLTRRLVKACQNKYVHAIGHPTGRHIGKRDPYDINFKEFCQAAADTNTFLEINAFPIRLDLDSANAYFARSMGVKFLINTDAHAVKHLSYMKFGVGVARRAWLTAEDVINTRTLAQLEKILNS